jgi:hypothetical protein
MPTGKPRLPLPWTIVGLWLLSLVAALIASRVSLVEGRWLWGFDSIRLDYPLATFFHDSLMRGSLPLWDDRIRLGYPLYAEGHIGAFYPPNWLIYLLPPLQALDVSRVLHLALAGLGGGLITLRMSGSRLGALATALVMVLCGGIAGKLEWSDVVVVYGWMPWVFLSLLWRRTGPTYGLVAIAAAVWGIQALGGHPPYWVMTGVAAIVIIAAQGFSMAGLKQIAAFGALGGLVGSLQLVPTALITVLSERALDRATLFEYSATPFDFLGVAFANAYVPATGSAWDFSKGWYPGGFWAILESYAYVGLAVLAFAAVGLRVRRARPLLLLAAVSIIIPMVGAIQPPFTGAIFTAFRHPVRAYLLLDVALAVGTGIGISRMGARPSVRTALGVVGLALVAYAAVGILAVLPPTALGGLIGTFWRQLLPYQTTGSAFAEQALTRMWPLALEVIVGVLALLALRVRPRSGLVQIAGVALVALPMATLVPQINQSLPASAFTNADTPLVQMLNSTSPRSILTVGEPYSPALDPVVGESGDSRPHVFSGQLAVAFALNTSTELLDDLRTELDTNLARAMGIDTIVTYGGGSCPGTLVAQLPDNGGETVCRLEGALRPPYWIPTFAVLGILRDSGTPLAPRDAAINTVSAIDNARSLSIAARDRWGAYMTVHAPSHGYVWIDRSWWPGWQTSVDGQSVETLRAWSGQLVPVPAGRHTIEERFVPLDLILGAILTSIGIVVTATVVLSIRLQRLHARRDEPAHGADST